MTSKSNEISDAAVKKATDRNWAQWAATLDAMGADKLAHAEIARRLRETHALSPWWSQMVTVHYERLRGLRQVHEKASGFEINVGRTVDLPIESAFEAWNDPDRRRRWAPSLDLPKARARPNHSIRAEGADGSKLTIRFTERAAGRTQVVVEHSKLETAAQVEPSRTFWRSILEGMDALRHHV